MQRDERFDTAESVILTGFWLNGALMLLKLAAGYWGHSDAVFADGIEGGCDFIALLSTMVALRLGRKPFDEEHPYGHGRAESLAALLVSLIIIASGVWVLLDSIQTVNSGTFKSPGLLAIGAALVTIVVKEWLCRFSLNNGNRLESPALLAVARDHRKDVVTSAATLIGVGGAYCGYGIMDPLAAGLTSFFILHVGLQTFRESAHDLMDGSAPHGFVGEVTRLAESVPRVEHVHDIRARRSGQFIIIDLKLDMDPAMTVKESHDIAIQVKQLIFNRFPNAGDVMIHINPHDEEHEDLTRL